MVWEPSVGMGASRGDFIVGATQKAR